MFKDNLNQIFEEASIQEALTKLEAGALKQTLFVVDKDQILLGTITDGDIRRALLNGQNLSESIKKATNYNSFFVSKATYTPETFQECKELKLKIIPLVDENKKLLNLLQLSDFFSFLPVQAVIMAGGEGIRLRPLTQETPKPMLVVGDKPIIEHNIDRLKKFGIQDINISLKYLGHKISDYFGTGDKKEIKISYTNETKPLGTLGSIKLIKEINEEVILVMNSDLLTNIDYNEMYTEFIKSSSDMCVATTSYKVEIPYAVLETKNGCIQSIIEKPTYDYPSNAGIYLIKKSCLQYIQENTSFNATDLIEILISKGKKVSHYPILGYWLDIGKHDDFNKAKKDIHHLKL